MKKRLSCEKQYIMKDTTDPMVFWEAVNFASVLRHRGDNINTGYPNLLQNLLRNENVFNINIWN